MEQLPEDILSLYKDNPDLMAQACQEAGWLLTDLQKCIDNQKIQESEKKTKDNNGLYVDSIDQENLMKDFTNVRITVDTAGTDYNKRALNREEAHFTPVNVDASIKVVTTGTITDVGTVNNTFTIDWGSAKKENYILKETVGTLTVTPAAAAVTTGSAKKEYDGRPLTSSEASITGLVNGETAAVTATGSITEVGTAENTYDINWGTAKKGNYTVSSNTGTLKVTGNTNPVTIRISFTGKTYDGKPLDIDHIEVVGQASDNVRTQSRSTGNVTVEGLPAGYRFKAKVSGKYTDAGTCQLTVDSYQILDPDGKDVTDGFTVVEITECTVTIDPAPVTVTTGSASKAYDGTPLTSDEASITGLIGKDAASVTLTATGSITDVGTSDNTYDLDWGTVKSSNYTVSEKIGTLEVTENSSEIIFKAPSDSKTYDGTPLQADSVTVTGLPEGFTATASASGSQTDAGSSENTVSSYKILNADGNDVTASFSNIKTENGTLTVDPASASVSTGSASKEYDSNPLICAEASISGLIDAEKDSVTVTATGIITDVGTTENTYTIDWGDAKSGNYTLSESLGTLEITKNTTEITFKAPSAAKTYDGTALKAGTVTVTGLPDGFTFTASASGSQTDAGSSESTVASYKILNADETDVTASFSNIKTEKGNLTVTPLEISFELNTYNDVYSGQKVFPDGTKATYGDGSELEPESQELVLDESENPESFTSIFNLTGGGRLQLDFAGYSDAGTWDATPTENFLSGKKDNYKISYSDTEFTIDPLELVISFDNPTHVYYGSDNPAGFDVKYGNGNKKGESPEKLDGLIIGHTGLVAKFAPVSGEVLLVQNNFPYIDVGTYTLSCVASITTGKESNYNISVTDNTLTITPAEATVSTGSASKEYDGKPLTSTEASISGLLGDDNGTVTVTATGTITDVGTAENTYTIDWGSAKSSHQKQHRDHRYCRFSQQGLRRQAPDQKKRHRQRRTPDGSQCRRYNREQPDECRQQCQ